MKGRISYVMKETTTVEDRLVLKFQPKLCSHRKKDATRVSTRLQREIKMVRTGASVEGKRVKKKESRKNERHKEEEQ